MVCDFYYRAQPESGNCSVDGDVLKLVMRGSSVAHEVKTP